MISRLRLDHPAYRPPAWLEGPRAGTSGELGVRVLGRPLAVRVWSPGEGELPLLVAHGGPEYDKLAGLTRYAGAMIEAGALPPFRVALLPPNAVTPASSNAAAWSMPSASCSPPAG